MNSLSAQCQHNLIKWDKSSVRDMGEQDLLESEEEKIINKRFIPVSVSFTVLVVFCTFILGLLLRPPTDYYSSWYFSSWYPIYGAIISITIIALLAGFLRINQKTREIASISSYFAAILTIFLCGILHYFVFIWSDFTFYRIQYFILFLITSIFLSPFLVLFLILLNRIFNKIGTKSRKIIAA